jgi:hypothetical protein
MVANSKSLGDLHGRLADAMSEALDAEVARIKMSDKLMNMDLEDLDEDTLKAVSTAISLAPTARVDNALLKTVSSFLKDNSITADLSSGEEEDEKRAALDRLKSRRTIAGTPVDLLN